MNTEGSGKQHFIAMMHSIGGSAVLFEAKDSKLVPLFVTEEFASMLELTPDDAVKQLSGGLAGITAEEDRELVGGVINSGKNHGLVFRVNTSSGAVLRCSSNFAFLNECGSEFVYITFFDITVMKAYEERLRNAYISLGESFYRNTDKMLGMFRVNLTRDTIEDIQGTDLYKSDSASEKYSELLAGRAEHCPIPGEREMLLDSFCAGKLISDYLANRTHVCITVFTEREDGRKCFAQLSANLTRHPVKGDLIAFISETENDVGKVNEILIDKILVRQFDMVSYIANGRYGVVVGDGSLITRGSIFPKTRKGDYREYLEAQVIPVLCGTHDETEQMKAALSPETIGENLAKREPYSVTISCEIDGGIYYKRFDFFTVDPSAQFWVVLKSDITEIHREQAERNENLRMALREAEQANIAKTAFLSRMSHEIRTPMNAIIGLDSIALHESNLPDHIKEHLEKIGSSARYLLTLINDILDMSRIESGKMTLKKEEFSFRDFLGQLNTMADSQCRDRGLEYECRVNGSTDEFYIGDNTKLKQVLINILGNAVKFTDPPGKVTLTVERISRSNRHTALRFVIKDTGIGMDEAFIPRIFDPFTQEDATTTSKYGGSGLGLAITKNIVGMMNGDITVTSKKGEGSCFTVDVTLRNTDRNGLESAVLSVAPQDLHVLVIDDDPDSCKHSSAVLEELGISSETCLSGDEALELIMLGHARRNDYNLILIDLRMPGQDGIEVTKRIRELIGDDTAIVILTAYSWQGEEERAAEAGVDGFIAKPLLTSDMIDEYRNAVTRKRLKASVKKETDLHGKRILVAEDVMINARIMMRILTMNGMTAEHAENGQIAVDMFSSKPEGYYDAILMDVRMPVMDGLSASKTIRALDRPDASKIPIIAMTANAFDEDVQMSLRVGMNAHLSKPVEPDLLCKTLASLIK